MQDKITNQINEQYGNKIRVRACGILIKEKKILLVKHRGLGKIQVFWSPPGGGIEFGETIHQAIKREFNEETNFVIEVKDFLLISEHLAPPLHAIEIFHLVTLNSGDIKKGFDPELSNNQQIIDEVKFLSKGELLQMDKHIIHPILLSEKILEML